MIWILIGPAVVLLGLVALWVVGERGHLILPSTRNAMRQRGATPGGAARSIAVLTKIHGYIYGRFIYQYIRFIKRHLFRLLVTEEQQQWWANHYHGKVLTNELACAIITLDHDIPRTDLDQVIPYRTARDILLKGPPNVTLLECPCRLAQEDHCSPTEVCMVVGGGEFMLDHHPTRTRRIAQDEALAVLHAEHERGHVHTAYFKDACDNKFYAICNCCSCCCGGLQAMVEHGVPMVTASGFVAEVDEGACIACGTCEELCPFDAVHVNGRSEVVFEKCMGCGVCEGHCDTGAITLVRDERKGIPLDVREIAVREPVPAGR